MNVGLRSTIKTVRKSESTSLAASINRMQMAVNSKRDDRVKVGIKTNRSNHLSRCLLFLTAEYKARALVMTSPRIKHVKREACGECVSGCVLSLGGNCTILAKNASGTMAYCQLDKLTRFLNLVI